MVQSTGTRAKKDSKKKRKDMKKIANSNINGKHYQMKGKSIDPY